uniref:Tr-type G domain-containing protein n=1 Tax=Chromera velia CCMP2878 TaxID=1169474 RepID=A0A0G4IEW2_9ALVE|mmetsp:Transcript_43463/g.85758  ORF Transcript_43463/g.85758 Transcript_43463/m.85758 type:complete len:208 (-) Transcript_43463:501-1124(-)|eukprot:Cvel_13790.t1-p1 / transcript=Cvel_13790.t1 / gene=Cvel_13790 / organism=Chromera_velia_CCMP2878 / gene_product=Elongation factor Tu, putative / transcript_product=Elongation factor Tu, putative / location=Cvel_scaffold956:6014-6634(+) / protein_length=207 / sequence_SO=supercontig / SO=protein_coding / is_pseudo=false
MGCGASSLQEQKGRIVVEHQTFTAPPTAKMSKARKQVVLLGQSEHGKSSLSMVLAKEGRAEAKTWGDLAPQPCEVECEGEEAVLVLKDMPASKIAEDLSGGPDVCALLVISVLEGPRDETMYHINMAKGKGIERLVVFVSKCDLETDSMLQELVKDEAFGVLVDAGFSEETAFVFGSALKAIEGDVGELGEEAIKKLVAELEGVCVK